MSLGSLRTSLKAKRAVDAPFWRAVFATNDAVDLVRRRRDRRRPQQAQLIQEVERSIASAVAPAGVAGFSSSQRGGHDARGGGRHRGSAGAGIAAPRLQRSKELGQLAALSAILKTTGTDGRILDAGAAFRSKILPWLSAYGYKNLIGINVSFRSTMRIGDIVYRHGDLTRTGFANDYFDAIACISVVAHGVDLRSCFLEMSRILKPNGILVMSTDYWPDRVDTSGLTTFDAAWTIFDREAIRGMIHTGASCGFALDGELKLQAGEKVVAWNGREYTFIYFALRKVAASCAA